MTYYCPLYFSCGLGTAKGYITIKYIKNEQFIVLLGTSKLTPRVVHSRSVVNVLVSFTMTHNYQPIT